MIATQALIAAGALVWQVASPADSLRRLATGLPQSDLILEVRAQPLETREAIVESFRRAVRDVAHADVELRPARHLAEAYAVAWNDAFFVRDVERFTAWPPARRAIRVSVDSARRAGIAAFARDGPATAIAIWRRALARATAARDTIAMAAVIANIGAALVEQGEIESAAEHLARARSLAARIGDLRVEANAVSMLGAASEERGDLPAARAHYAHALAMRTRFGDSRGEAADRNNLGLVAQRAGDLVEARQHFEAALTLNRRAGRDESAATNLVNLAGLASLDGDFQRAEAHYRDALATWRAQESWSEASDALHGLGVLELRRGDYPAAIAALREALSSFERAGRDGEAFTVRRLLAAALAATGDLQAAVDELRLADRSADSSDVRPGERAEIALARADLALQLNELADADRLFAEAEALFRASGDATAGAIEARHGRALLLLERGDHRAARPLLDATMRAQMSSGDARSAAVTRMALAEATLAGGDTAGARQLLAEAARALEQTGDAVALAAALGERADLEAAAGEHAAAESLYRDALRRIAGRAAPGVAWRLQAGLAGALRARGALEEAVRADRAALAELEAPGERFRLAERRARFMSDKWTVYAELARTEYERGRAEAAFELSEQLRAREMLELLSRGRVAPRHGADADLVAREQDLRRRLNELGTASMSRRSPAGLRGTDVAASPVARDAELSAAQDAYAAVLLEMREHAPEHGALVAPRTATWRDVAHRLGSDEAFVEYLVSDSATLAFVIVRDTMTVVRLAPTRRDLVRLIEFVRGALPRGVSARADSLWRGAMRRLDGHLIAPIEATGLLARTRRLVIAPHAELHYLPFAALTSGARADRALIDRYTITFTPSASVWLALGDRVSAPATAGVLAMAPQATALPASRREVAAVARLAGADVRVLEGAAATEDAFRRDAASRAVLHLATNGVLNKHNPLFSFVQLAPDRHGRNDGRLEVHEVFGLRLAARLVVLSACETGLGSGAMADVPSGDDWVGLTRAFLHAGAEQVVATLWAVEDWATAALMERFYERLATGADPATALADAQRAIRGVPATAHPFYWAGFVVVGGGAARADANR